MRTNRRTENRARIAPYLGRTVYIGIERLGNGLFFGLLAQLHILPEQCPQPKKRRERGVGGQTLRNFP